mmetsp:Transcript_21333/g.19408  ORF Transcript_21333/g.19408 Transcript_21333/m.19408 type:complete len:140 (+) Transcript_21333:46-465(+)
MIDVVLSGLFGALTSILGKISLSESTPVIDYIQYYCEISILITNRIYCINISFAIRLICFILMIYFNMLTFTFFLKALETRGSLPVTVISSATNFLVTGILSGILLGENINQQWYLGAFIIVFGVCLIALSQGNGKRTE